MNLFRVNSAYQGYDKNTKEIQCITVNEFNGEKTLTLFSKDYIGRIFPNDKKGNEKAPDYTFFKKDEIKVAVWVRLDKNNNKYFSTNIELIEGGGKSDDSPF